MTSDINRIEQALAGEGPSSGSSTAATRGLGRRRRPCSEPGSGGGAGVRPQTRGNNLRLAGVDPIRTPHFQIESQFSKSISWSMHWHAHPIKFHANESLSHLFLRSLQYASPSARMPRYSPAHSVRSPQPSARRPCWPRGLSPGKTRLGPPLIPERRASRSSAVGMAAGTCGVRGRRDCWRGRVRTRRKRHGHWLTSPPVEPPGGRRARPSAQSPQPLPMAADAPATCPRNRGEREGSRVFWIRGSIVFSSFFYFFRNFFGTII